MTRNLILKSFTNCIIIAAVFLSVSCSGVSGDEVTVETWNVLFSRTASPDAALKSTGWEKIKLPRLIRPPYPGVYEEQYFWLKGTIHINNPAVWYGLAMGRVYFTDTTLINGQLIGEHTEDELNELHKPRFYRIPRGLLRNGKNEILIRIGTFGQEYGGIYDPVRFMKKEKFINSRILYNFIFIYLPLGIIIFFLGPLIFSIILLVLKKDTLSNLLMLAIIIFWATYLLAVYSPWFPFSHNLRITILWTAVSLMPILFFIFIQSYYKTFLTSLNRILVPLLFIFILIILIINDASKPNYPGRILGLATLALTVPAHLYLLYALNVRKPGKTALYLLLFGVCPIGIFIGWDIINYIFINHVPPMVHIYFLPVVAVLYLYLRIKEVIKNEIRMEILYNNLSRQFRGGKSTDKSPNITTEMEEKLDQVIIFIRENYQSSISREGLARAVNISPDHMSRSFKQYTGKRILDYINELRIREAEEQLKNSDKKIIDIAFDVGFENLPSFNRIFYKINKVNPSGFRELNKDKVDKKSGQD